MTTRKTGGFVDFYARWHEGQSGWEGLWGNPCNPKIRVIRDSDKEERENEHGTKVW